MDGDSDFLKDWEKVREVEKSQKELRKIEGKYEKLRKIEEEKKAPCFLYDLSVNH